MMVSDKEFKLQRSRFVRQVLFEQKRIHRNKHAKNSGRRHRRRGRSL